MTRRRLLRGLGLLLVLALAADQVVQWTVLRDGYFRGRRVAPFDPPLFNARQERVLAILDGRAEPDGPARLEIHPVYGWLGAADAGPDDRRDGTGCRWDGSPLLRERRADRRRLVTLGCSFTRGDEVPHDAAWPARLERLVPGWEVGNLGASGHGVDQSLLRWRLEGAPLRPDAVWLGVFPPAGRRLVGRYRPAVYHGSGAVAFKPRFRARDDGLELVPVGPATAAATVAAVSDQRRFLAVVGADDFFVNLRPEAYAPRGSHWSHWSAAARLWLTRREDRDRPSSSAWLRDDDSEVSRLLDALVGQLAREVADAGARFRVVVLPSHGGLGHRQRRGASYWEGRVSAWRDAGIAVTDLAEPLAAAGFADDERWWAPKDHYSAEGNAVVAEALAPLLRSP